MLTEGICVALDNKCLLPILLSKPEGSEKITYKWEIYKITPGTFIAYENYS